MAIERFWRSLKYEEVYLKDYADLPEAEREIGWLHRAVQLVSTTSVSRRSNTLIPYNVEGRCAFAQVGKRRDGASEKAEQLLVDPLLFH